MNRVLCPRHKEKTPSCIVYPNGWHCFGCGASGPLSEIGLQDRPEIHPRYVEDVAARIKEINQLPVKNVRGLLLHADFERYYIVWPNASYYKSRRFKEVDYEPKYKCPPGVAKPLFVLGPNRPVSKAIIVEGELNALSIWDIVRDRAVVVSPGGAGDFYSKQSKQVLQVIRGCSKIVVVVDNDAAGAVAGIKLKALLHANQKRDVEIVLVGRDFNEVLEKEGKEALRAYTASLGVS